MVPTALKPYLPKSLNRVEDSASEGTSKGPSDMSSLQALFRRFGVLVVPTWRVRGT